MLMSEHNGPRLLRIVVSDEETGEEVATVAGVETLVILATPDTLRHEAYRHLLIGDGALSVQLLFDVLKDVVERMGRGTVMDMTSLLDDQLLLEVTDGLPLH